MADENAGCIFGGGVAAHHEVGVAALLQARVEGAPASSAPARLPLQRLEPPRKQPQDSLGNIHRNLCG